MVKQSYQENITIVMENLEYGGATTHLISLINNKRHVSGFVVFEEIAQPCTKHVLALDWGQSHAVSIESKMVWWPGAAAFIGEEG